MGWGWRPLQPADALSPHILHHSTPEPGTGYIYSGLFFIEVMAVVFDYFRGINHWGHAATPSRRIRLLRMGLIRSLPTYRHGCPTSSTPSFHWCQQNGSWMRDLSDSEWLSDRSRRTCRQDSRQYGRTGPRGLMRGIVREETTQRLIQPRGMPHRGTQPGVRESLVGTCIVIDIGSNDACYSEVASTLLEKRGLLTSWSSLSIAKIDSIYNK